jgi:hypothetical protein
LTPPGFGTKMPYSFRYAVGMRFVASGVDVSRCTTDERGDAP